MKVAIRQNVWGNWYGYIGGRVAAQFFGNETEQSTDARAWECAVNGLTAVQRREALQNFKANGVTFGAAVFDPTASRLFRLPEPRPRAGQEVK